MAGVTQDSTKCRTIVASIESNILKEASEKNIDEQGRDRRQKAFKIGKVYNDILKQLWTQRRPRQMKPILSVSEDSLEKLLVSFQIWRKARKYIAPCNFMSPTSES